MNARPLEDITAEFEFREVHDALRRLAWMLQDEASPKKERIEEAAHAGFNALMSLQMKHRAVRARLERAHTDLAKAVAVFG